MNKDTQVFQPVFHWPDEKIGLYDAIFWIETQAIQPFSLHWVTEQLKLYCHLWNPRPEPHIQSLLDQSYNLGTVSNQSRVYYPGKFLFENQYFYVAPTKEEIQNGVLIFGHRFFPWISFFCQPDDTVLLWKERELQHLFFEHRLDRLLPYYSFMAKEEIASILIISDNHDTDSLEYYCSPAFDLNQFYKDEDISAGDMLKLHVIDYWKGIVEIFPWKKEAMFAKRRETVERERLLEDNVRYYIRNFRHQLSPIKGILDCYSRLYHTDHSFAGPINWTHLISESKKLHLYYYFDSPNLATNEQKEEEILENLFRHSEIQDGRCETLDDLFYTGNSDLGYVVLRAYLLNAVADGTRELTDVLKDVLEVYSMESLDEQKTSIFEALCLELWEEVQKLKGTCGLTRKICVIREIILRNLERLQHILAAILEVELTEEEQNAGDLLNELERLRTVSVGALDILESPLSGTETLQIRKRMEEVQTTIREITLSLGIEDFF